MDLGKIGQSDLLIVGSGFFGLTVARLAADQGFKAVVLEKRHHIGGNAHSYVDQDTGVEVHKYGSHLFHTSNKKVWDFVNRFSGFNNYRHTVKTVHKGQVFSMPINLGTMSQFFGKKLSPAEARQLIADQVSNPSRTINFEDKALSQIGQSLYEAFIKGYTHKQWQVDPIQLPSSVFSRLPVRYNFDDSYFSDTFEGLPLSGYYGLIEELQKHENIQVYLGIDYFDLRQSLELLDIPIIFTGPIDRFFDYKFGRLSWRTLDFEFKSIEVNDFQGTAVMNFADTEVPYTRIHEFKHLHPEREHNTGLTSIAYEFSRWAHPSDEPYYPVNSESDRSALLKYRELMKNQSKVFFGGRLGTYKYLDMHMAIASAHKLYEAEIATVLSRRRRL